MPFDPVDPRQSLPALERGILRYWQEEDAFKRSIHNRSRTGGDLLDGMKRATEEEKVFSFFDGPPFATGLPHYGHLLAGTIKDVIPRYQTMCGKRVERRFGWDCHGLPVEYEIEKEHGIDGKREIEAMGVKAFHDLCRAAVLRYTKEWRVTVERMGRWVDMDHDYRTMDADYMESIWWVFGELYRKGLIYEGHKSMHICPRCATPLSNFEVTQGYRDITDYAVTVQFHMQESKETKESKEAKEPISILAWTTTPWTLPGNLFLAVGSDREYSVVEAMGAQYILASDRIGALFQDIDHTVIHSMKGAALLGKRYTPLFPYFAEQYRDKAFRVVDGSEFVTTDEGTGIVHIATGFGEDDFKVGKREFGKDYKPLQHVGMDGKFTAAVTDFAGLDVKPKDDPAKTDKKLADWLKEHGKLFRAEPYSHSYPHCWRCDSPLLNYATSSWFVAVEKIKENILKTNAMTEWVPAHIRDGRFGKWLEGARDWAISRARFWGTPLPIWRCPETGEIEVICSRDDLMLKRRERFTKVTVLRHGESEGNVSPRYQGVAPGTDLTAKGCKQAQAAAQKFGKWVDRIYCSPLARTRQTAQAIAELSRAEIIPDERLREVRFGEYEGKSIDFADLTFVKARRAHKLETGQVESIYHFPGMETWSEVQERIRDFLQEVLPRHRGEHIVIVTHADPLQNFRHFFTTEDPTKLCNQPYPGFAVPHTFYWDHDTHASLDLHRETVDEIVWPAVDGRSFFRRIPDVLDCWFESGAMPYAQSHYPFEALPLEKTRNEERGTVNVPPGFPADFIAEGIDQTRGWFYTLMVLSTALFGLPAFKHCVVNGTVLAADGKKMSKRLKNYPEPLEVVERHGADAVRFALVSSPAVRGEDMRFSEHVVEEAVRTVLLPLWNAYAFFVTYANIAGFEPSESRRSSDHPLDRWIRAEMQDLVNRMTEQLDRYDLSATCGELSETIDALTNWYVRLSRRRFSGKAVIHAEEAMEEMNEQDRLDALSTLYDVLLTVCQLLAPLCPFITEVLYLNLVPGEHGSIHFTDWPEPRILKKREKELLHRTRLLRTAASLGRRIRSTRRIALRSPLARATVAIPPSFLPFPLTSQELALLQEELNVKKVEVVEDPGAIAEPFVQVDARKVGPRLGARVQEIIQAGKRGDFTITEDGRILILDEALLPGEATVVYRGREGGDIAADRGIVLSLDTTITEELRKEGAARELIRGIQQLRKEEGCALTDTIELQIEGLPDLLSAHGSFIAEETKAVLMPVPIGTQRTLDVGDRKWIVRFRKKGGS